MRERKLNRLHGYDYSRDGYYFVTVCAQNRECLFGEIGNGEMILNEYGKIVNNVWQWLGRQYEYVSLDQFIIMPNHMHGIICCRGGSRTAPTVKRKSLGRLIGAFKTVSTKQINQTRNTPDVQLWQRSFYDHIIRNDTSLNRIREYINNNPAQWESDIENTVGAVREPPLHNQNTAYYNRIIGL